MTENSIELSSKKKKKKVRGTARSKAEIQLDRAAAIAVREYITVSVSNPTIRHTVNILSRYCTLDSPPTLNRDSLCINDSVFPCGLFSVSL